MWCGFRAKRSTRFDAPEKPRCVIWRWTVSSAAVPKPSLHGMRTCGRCAGTTAGIMNRRSRRRQKRVARGTDPTFSGFGRRRLAAAAFLIFGLASLAGELPVVPVGYDAYRQWDRWAQQRIGVRAYLWSTYDRSGGNEAADASHF